MMSRRELVKASLILSSCVPCSALGLSTLAHEVQADSPIVVKGNGYDLWFIGGQRDTIMNGKLAAELDLRTLAGKTHLYGIGPIEQLRGEVTILDSRPALARVAPDGTVVVTQSLDAGVPFLVWAQVLRWREIPIAAGVRSFEDLERFIPTAASAAGLDPGAPLPFLVEGRHEFIEFHIVNRIGDAPHSMEMHRKIQMPFQVENTEATLVGFHSMKHRGIFTPGDSNIHIHFQVPDNHISGHVQKLLLSPNAILKFPVPTS